MFLATYLNLAIDLVIPVCISEFVCRSSVFLLICGWLHTGAIVTNTDIPLGSGLQNQVDASCYYYRYVYT